MTPTEFEHRIAEIHALLESDDAVVTWNDRIPDPDNPDQLRQIDISIRREGRVTHIECRHRQKPEDTTRIESLIGRKQSLSVDAMIGVSSSGFTSGAIKKAAAFGIFLFELAQLSAEEVASWGKSSQVEVLYFDLFELEVQPVLVSMPTATPEALGVEFLGPPNLLDLLLNQIRYALNQNRDITAPYSFFFEPQAQYDAGRSSRREGPNSRRIVFTKRIGIAALGLYLHRLDQRRTGVGPFGGNCR